MAQHTIPLEEFSQLVIPKVGGSLFLTGWNREEIRIKDPVDQDVIKKEKDRIEITFPNDGIVHLPHHLPVIIKSIGGDLVIKDIRSPIEVSKVGGDLTLSNVSLSTVKSVGGDVFAKRIQDDLVIDKVGNDCLIDTVLGQLSLKKVGRDIQIGKVVGGIDAKSGGDGQVNISPVPWQAYRIEVGGDLSITVPEDSNADLSIKSGKSEITVMFGSIDEKVKEKEHKLQVGEGGPAILLSAGGKVFISSDKFNWLSGLKINAEELESIAVDFSSQTTEQIRTHLNQIEVDLRDSLSGLSDSLDSVGLSEENLKQIITKIEESSLVAAQKAEMAAVKARAKIEKKITKAHRKAQEMKRKTKEFDLNQFLSMEADKQSVSDSERLMILEMLQEKKISLGEADDLLKALEGKKKR